MSTLNRVGCFVVDTLTAILFSAMAIVLALGGFCGAFAAAMYFHPDSPMQLIGCFAGLAFMWSAILPMKQIEKLDFGYVSC